MKWKELLRKHSGYLVVLTCIVFVWLGATMSDYKKYAVTIPVEWEGVDSTRYVVLSRDSALKVDVNSTGFSALLRSTLRKPHPIRPSLRQFQDVEAIPDRPMTIQVAVHSIIVDNSFVQSVFGAKEITSTTDSIGIVIARLHTKQVPIALRVDDVDFAVRNGVTATPYLLQHSAEVNGSMASLARVDSIYTLPITIHELDHTDTLNCPFDIKRLNQLAPDLRVHTPVAHVVMPVEQFIEQTFVVPIEIEHDADIGSEAQVLLYPSRVTLSVWVPASQICSITAANFRVTARFQTTNGSDELPLLITQYPSNVRIKHCSHQHVKHVIIKQHNAA
ncbi:MAG: hypothetical protein IJV22_01065 [Bacteroidales bacterium]|nr:hypothetical protein [Bacteroidales bacterium]